MKDFAINSSMKFGKFSKKTSVERIKPVVALVNEFECRTISKFLVLLEIWEYHCCNGRIDRI